MKSSLKNNKKVEIEIISANDIKGEHNKTSNCYQITLFFVSVLALVSNLVKILIIKITKKRKTPFLKVLWEMGRDPKHFSSLFVDRFSRFNHQAKYGAADWRSLDVFYNYHEKIKPQLKNNLEGFLTKYWDGKMQNRQAVSNRLKLSVKLLNKAVNNFKNEEEIRLVSIASGSAQAVLMFMKENLEKNIKAVLIDLDKGAIEKSRENAEKAGLADRFTYVNKSYHVLEEVCADFKPHIIEMVGFMDYQSYDKAIKLVNRIYKSLLPESIFITANICPNKEKIFLDWVLLWPMIYKTEYELAEILVKGGFNSSNVKIYLEPFKIHAIGFCKK